MSYTALYRKFRPTTFDEVKGQDAIITTLKNQLRAGRIGHAYLFCGTRGTGKTTVAKILARAVNCEHPTENGPCNECDTCRSILSGTSTNVIEIDAASNNGVDNIREIREEVSYRPTQGKYKVYIIDEVHMLSVGAFNALLKTLEEPPEYVIFILATTEANKIPVTILSRCQRYDFKRISIDTIAARLDDLLKRENVEAEEKAVRYIARAADGSMRDALSLLDQCIAFYLGEKLTYDKVLNVLGTVDTDVFSRLLRRVIDGDAAGSIHILEQLIESGKEMGQFASDFTWYMRNLMLIQSSDDLEDVLDVSTENLQQLKEESRMIDAPTLMRFIRIFSELSSRLRYETQKRVLVETALIRLCRPEMDRDMDAVLQRISSLEKQAEERSAVSGVNPDILRRMLRDTERTGAFDRLTPDDDQGQTQKTVPKAAPEDLKKIRSMWLQIVGRTDGLMKAFLQNAVPEYDAAGNGGSTLYLAFSDENARLYFTKNPEHLDELKQIIRTAADRDVELEVVTQRDANRGELSEIPLEKMLSENIGMPVEMDDSDDTVF